MSFLHYTRAELDKRARQAAALVRKETGQPAKFRCWTICISTHAIVECTLEVTIDTRQGWQFKRIVL